MGEKAVFTKRVDVAFSIIEMDWRVEAGYLKGGAMKHHVLRTLPSPNRFTDYKISTQESVCRFLVPFIVYFRNYPWFEGKSFI